MTAWVDSAIGRLLSATSRYGGLWPIADISGWLLSTLSGHSLRPTPGQSRVAVTGAATFINGARTTRRLSPKQPTNSISASPGSEAHSAHVRYVVVPPRSSRRRNTVLPSRMAVRCASGSTGHCLKCTRMGGTGRFIASGSRAGSGVAIRRRLRGHETSE